MLKALLVTLDYPPQIGGVAVYYESLVKQFSEDDISVLTVDEVAGQKVSEKKGIIRKKLLFRQRWLRPQWLPLFWQMRKIVKKNGVKLIQVGQILPIGIAALVLKKISGTSYVVYCHGMDLMMASKKPRKRRMAARILKNAEFIVANSEFTKRKAMEYGARERDVIVVYPCPNTALKRSVLPEEIEELRNKYGLRNKKIILTTGRLVERKGYDVVLGAMAKLKELIPDVHYAIVGEGQLKAQIEQMIKVLKLNDSVTLVGKVTDYELAVWYEICDIFVMISRQLKNEDVEGFGIVYLEANMFGKPVVAGKSGGTGEAVTNGETGILVEPTNAQEILSALERLLKNPEEAKIMGENGRRRVEVEFQWEKQAAPLIERIMRYE